MAKVKVSELTEANSVNDNDYLMILQNSTNKKIKKETLTESSKIKKAIKQIQNSIFTYKNSFNINAITEGYWVNSQGQYNENSGWNIGESIKVKPSTSYTMSRQETTGAYQVGIAEYDENNNFVQQQAQWQTGVNSKTFTTSATTKYVRPMYNKNYSMTNIQFEEGSTATNYEPYIEEL